ncbi:MAG: DUF4391 domain-containing protein [Sideroxyarcus sp.]|nr:DUF4391 domain-containing protein [Sideroxyarcus sp.]
MSLFAYPKQAEFNRVLPKSKIYEHGKPSRAVRDGFVTQINQIVWQYKLAPETINLPARPSVPEIEIFSLELKTPEVNEDVLRCIDKAIPLPIFYNLSFAGHIKTVAAYKRPSDADASRWVVDAYFESPWLPAQGERSALPVALDMAGLYEQMLRRLMPFPARQGEALKDHVERLNQLRSLQNEHAKLEIRLHREKQFNRKVELNSRLRAIKADIETLAR